MKPAVVVSLLLGAAILDSCHCAPLRPPSPKDGRVATDASPSDAAEPNVDAVDSTCFLPPCFAHWSAPEWQAFALACIPTDECRVFFCPRWETQATICNTLALHDAGGVLDASSDAAGLDAAILVK